MSSGTLGCSVWWCRANFCLGGPDLLPRPIHGTSRAETQHRILTKSHTAPDKFWDPGVLYVKFWSKILCLEAPGSCPGFLSQAPWPHTSDAASISTLSRLRMLRQGSLVVLRLQNSWFTMKAKSSNAIFDGLYNFRLVRCAWLAEACWTGPFRSWLGLIAGHGARGAGACHALCVEAEFRYLCPWLCIFIF